jgi:hypothetical protein
MPNRLSLERNALAAPTAYTIIITRNLEFGRGAKAGFLQLVTDRKRRMRVSSHKKHLEAMQSEVLEFHPFLEQLFRALPDVKRVEYTHGPSEMGADFVLEKHDSTTGRKRYVGVIAKLGNIKQGDATLSRQIEECRVPRKVQNGEQRVRLNEIWVVSSGRISNNAQEKILELEKYLAVQFFGVEDVTSLVDQHAPDLWHSGEGLVGRYLRELTLSMTALDRAARLVPEFKQGGSFSVPIRFVEPDELRARRNSRRGGTVTLHEAAQQHSFMYLEGAPGAGKSHAVRQAVMQLANVSSTAGPSAIPVFVSYRELVNDFESSLQNCLDAKLGNALEEAIALDVPRVIFIDGLDELAVEAAYGAVLADLHSQRRSMHRVHVLVSARSGTVPGAVLKSLSSVTWLRAEELSSRQVVEFVKSVVSVAAKRTRVLTDIRTSDLFRQIPKNPIAALLLSKLLLEQHDEVPQTLTELYRISMEIMLGRWRGGAALSGQQDYLIAEAVAQGLAEEAVMDQRVIHTTSELRSRIEAYVRERNLATSVERVIARVSDRAGLFHVNEQSGVVQFKHRSFAEYLVAQKWRESAQVQADARVFVPYWRNVFFFVCGLKPDCESLVTSILAVAPTSESEKFGRFMYGAEYLLAAHMTPYRVIEKALPHIMLTAAELYDDVVQRRTTSVLATLSESHLLWLFAFISKRQYGYRFFQRAFDAACITVSDSGASRRTQAIALYLLATTVADLDHSDPFGYLAKEFSADEVPLPVALAVSHESKMSTEMMPSARVRAFNRQLRKMLKARSDAERVSLEHFLERLKTTPIDPSSNARLPAK